MNNDDGIIVNGKKRRQRVDVFAIGPNNTLLAFSRGLDSYLEFPGGGIDAGEDIVTAGERELAEEAGWPATECKEVKVERLVYTAEAGSWLREIGFDEEEQYSMSCKVSSFKPDKRYATEEDELHFTLMPIDRILMELNNTVDTNKNIRSIKVAKHRIEVINKLFNIQKPYIIPTWKNWK